MNCQQCREQWVAYAERLLDPQHENEIERHWETCSACRAEAAEQRKLHDRLVKDGEILARVSLEHPVMNRIAREQALKSRRTTMSKRYGKAGLGLVAAAAIAVVLLVPWGDSRKGQASAAAAAFAQAVEATSNLRSVYLKVNMRTSPHDNFELIGLDYDFVPIEMWKQFSDPPRWRAEEPGRIVVMDGESTVCLMKPNHAYASGFAPVFQPWVGNLMDVHQALDAQLRCAQEKGWEFRLAREQEPDGAPKLVVTIEAQAQSDFSNTNDYLRNTSIGESDHRRVYRFDARTKLLEDLEVWVHDEGKDVLVLEVAEIVYDPDLESSLFTLALPDDVIWFQEPEVLPDNERYARMSAEEAARAFFQACADNDWDEVLKFWSASALDQRFKDGLGGLEIIHIGEPFKSGQYPGWFVPYEVKLTSGQIRKHNLALRNDNPAGRYHVDGGL
jgi:hypothetical protein